MHSGAALGGQGPTFPVGLQIHAAALIFRRGLGLWWRSKVEKPRMDPGSGLSCGKPPPSLAHCLPI